MAAGVEWMTADARADARGHAADERERTGGTALERRPAVVGHRWPSAAGPDEPVPAWQVVEMWTLAYVYGTVFARLGGVRALAGRCGGGVGGVGGASAMHVCDAWLYALSVCMCDCTS